MLKQLTEPVPRDLANEIDHQMVALLSKIDRARSTNVELRAIWLALEGVRLRVLRLTALDQIT